MYQWKLEDIPESIRKSTLNLKFNSNTFPWLEYKLVFTIIGSHSYHSYFRKYWYIRRNPYMNISTWCMNLNGIWKVAEHLIKSNYFQWILHSRVWVVIANEVSMTLLDTVSPWREKSELHSFFLSFFVLNFSNSLQISLGFPKSLVDFGTLHWSLM